MFSRRKSPASGGADPDYAEEGRRLLSLVNLGDVGAPERYSPVNALWKHPGSGAVLYVGNASTAGSRAALDKIQVRRIVFCQQDDGRCHFEGDPEFVYLKFPIGVWNRTIGGEPSDGAVLEYFAPLFSFVESELEGGNSVLIHCLAGAHRAGTAGVACLMHLCDLEKDKAIRLAKTLRPAIDPIGSFPRLLSFLQAARTNAARPLPSPAEAATAPPLEEV